MVDLSQIPSELKPALAIFLKELAGHLEYLGNALGDVERFATAASLNRFPEAQVLEHRFHVIKGGASFFKLDAVREAAACGEEMFRHGEVHTTEPDRLVHDFRRVVTTLGEQAEALRVSFK